MSEIYIDDADPRVQYSTGWIPAGVAEEYNSTTHWTEKDGATATLVFTGTGVAVYGTMAPKQGTVTVEEPPITLYTVDGGQASYYAAPNLDEVQYRVHFFSSQPLQNGQHTVVITKIQIIPSFFLDYFVVSSPSLSQSSDVSSMPPLDTTTTIDNTSAPGSNTVPLSTTSPNPSSNYTSSSESSVTNTALAAVTPTTSSATTATSSSTPAGAIVGTLLGCFILIMFILWLRRHLRHKSSSQPMPHIDSRCSAPAVVPIMRSTNTKMMHRTLQSSRPARGAYDGATTSHTRVQGPGMEGTSGEGHRDSPIDAPPRYSDLTNH